MILLISLTTERASAQFNFPVPPVAPKAELDGFDVRKRLVNTLPNGEPAPNSFSRGKEIRARADYARLNPDSAKAKEFAAEMKHFCDYQRFDSAVCALIVQPDSLVAHIDTAGYFTREWTRTYVHPRKVIGLRLDREDIGQYLRQSAGGDGLAFIPQFAANLSDNEAYVVTNVIRGMMGATLFSLDQASVVTRSSEADKTKRSAIEGDKANALRAVNNGGTLVARVAVPFWVRSAPTVATAVGISLATGMIGPMAANDTLDTRTGSVSAVLEMVNAFPVRDIVGSNARLADFIVSVRGGVTESGRSLRAAGGRHDVEFAQLMLGLRQNSALSVSALVTVANNGFNELVPRLGINFSATH